MNIDNSRVYVHIHIMTEQRDLNQAIEDLKVVMCTCASLRRASRAVTQFYDNALKSTGLTTGQFTVLAALSARGPVRQIELANILAMDRTTLIRNLRPLEDKQFVAVDTANPRGAKTLSLTKLGGDTLRQSLPHWDQAQSHMIAALGQDRWRGLIDALNSTVRAVQDQ